MSELREQRFSEPRLSATKAHLLLAPSCPALFKWALDHPTEPTPAMEFGSVVHTLLLGDGDPYVVLDPAVHGLNKNGALSENPKATGAWKLAEAKARADGVIPISADDYLKAQAMVAAVREHRWAGPLFEDGEPERRLEFIDPETGVKLAGRVDWLTFIGDHAALVDYKTAACAHPPTWARKAIDFGYYLQGAFYIALATLMGIDANPKLTFVVQEKEPPYIVSVIEYDASALMFGAKRMRRAVDLYHRCWLADEWPTYTENVYVASLPQWLLNTEPAEQAEEEIWQ